MLSAVTYIKPRWADPYDEAQKVVMLWRFWPRSKVIADLDRAGDGYAATGTLSQSRGGFAYHLSHLLESTAVKPHTAADSLRVQPAAHECQARHIRRARLRREKLERRAAETRFTGWHFFPSGFITARPCDPTNTHIDPRR